MTGSSAARWARGITVATLASQIGVLWLVAANRDVLPEHAVDYLPFAVGSVFLLTIFPALASVILTRFPRHSIGWILCGAAGTGIVDALARAYAIDGLYLHPGRLPAPEIGAWVADWNWFPAFMSLLVLVPLLVPDGRPASPRWRVVTIAAAWGIGLATIGLALVPEPLVDFPDVAKPVQVPAAYALAWLMLLSPVAVGAALASVIVRRRRAQGDEREQMRWLIYALVLAVAGWTATMILGTLGMRDWTMLGGLLTWVPLALLPTSITIAIVKYRLYDIDALINRTLVYGGLTTMVLGVYAVVVLAVSATTPSSLEWRWSVLVVAAVAILAYPLREWLQRLVNRFMYGDRDDPARALSRLARRIGDALSPATLLPAVVEAIGQALRLPYVAVQLAGDPAAPAAAYGTLRGEPHRIDLVHQQEPVGTLLVGRRAASEQFSAADLRVLEDVSHQVAVAAHAVRLSEDLQRSRERLVLAREEERRRLRRDLHDGIGSALAGLALHAGNARTALPDAPDEALRWVLPLEDGIRATVADVRRIVDDLRPPALDELGLAGALRERAEALHPGTIVVDSGLNGTPLPAAVEVAAYRIATEALANVARHASASRVTLHLAVDGGHPPALRVEVVDDGAGLPADVAAGVGLRSMAERAAEVGGTCGIMRRATRGTTVRAVLPIPALDESGGPS